MRRAIVPMIATQVWDGAAGAVRSTVVLSGQAQVAGPGNRLLHASCQRVGSLDAAIRCAQPNDLAGLVVRLPALQAIAHNGGESARAIRVTSALGLPVRRLPSTSPANASWSLERRAGGLAGGIPRPWVGVMATVHRTAPAT